MGTSQSSQRAKEHYNQQHGGSSSKYATRNSSVAALDRHNHGGPSTQAGSIHNNSSNSTSLQKALSRRRSSNKPGETGSSHGSTHSGGQNDSRMPSHQEDDEDYVWYHGRRYHNTDSLYMLPNDSQEVDRLHMQHYIFKAALEKNIHVPIPENGRVMEFGCGPATWTMDMATEMSTINFVGVDISPIYPTAIYPRNCNFYNEDFLHGVSQPHNVFDVVFQRNVSCGLTLEHWQQAMKEAFRILKPGGYYECVESDVTVQNAGPQTELVFEHLRQSMRTRNVDSGVVRSLNQLMAAAGFVDVNVKEVPVPVGDWGGKVGQLWKQNVFSILETVRPQLARAARITEAQVQEVVNAMHQETFTHRAFQVVYVAYGKKPLA
ncbi:hypothetical protein BGX27_008650 [Mortierella sp. AM989]|nr:hypothetical protein BGX27_008650 [Mortierella sp. AM989]